MKTKQKRTLTEVQENFEHFYRGGTPYIGEYKFSKDKVLLVMPERGEDEVWVSPDDVKLEQYTPVNSKDIYEHFIQRCHDFRELNGVEYDDLADFNHKWRRICPPTKE